MSDVSRGLDELLAAHESIGSPLLQSLRPGRRSGRSGGLLGGRLVPPEQVLEWFAWHGYDRRRLAGGRRPDRS